MPVHGMLELRQVSSGLWNRSAKKVGRPFRRALSHSSNSIAAFDNLIRGALTFLIAGFLQPLVVIAGAAGGALIALG